MIADRLNLMPDFQTLLIALSSLNQQVAKHVLAGDRIKLGGADLELGDTCVLRDAVNQHHALFADVRVEAAELKS